MNCDVETDPEVLAYSDLLIAWKDDFAIEEELLNLRAKPTKVLRSPVNPKQFKGLLTALRRIDELKIEGRYDAKKMRLEKKYPSPGSNVLCTRMRSSPYRNDNKTLTFRKKR